MRYRFFDSASTTRCCEAAARLLHRYATEDFGNPSSSHAYGQQTAQAIRDARRWFADHFRIEPSQVIFTGSGSEADNLAIYGVTLEALAHKKKSNDRPFRVLASATEHPAVRKTVQSLQNLGIDSQLIPVDAQGQIDRARFLELLTPETLLVSIQQVNNITGAELPVEELARIAKGRVPNVIFHTDAVQGFGKAPTIIAPSAVDLISISAHKVKGPKGVGALIVLNKKLLKDGFRPIIWGGEQENGMRSGTQNAGLIAGFHVAAAELLGQRESYSKKMSQLRQTLRETLASKGLLSPDPEKPAPLRWNSPEKAVPHIVSLSVPGFPTSALAKLLEERGFLISTGSACSSAKAEPDAALTAMGLPAACTQSAIRISFCDLNTEEDVAALVDALDESITLMTRLLGGGLPRAGHAPG